MSRSSCRHASSATLTHPSACFNVPPVCPGTRRSPRGHMAATVGTVLYHRGQFRELATLIALSGGLFL